MAKRKEKYNYQLQMSEDCRRSKTKQEAVLKWIQSDKRFNQDGRKPTVEELTHAALKPGTLLYKARVFPRTTKEAANEYYRAEAQYFLRHVQVYRIEIRTKKASPPVRAFIPITYSAGGRIDENAYLTAKRVANDPSFRETIIERAYRDLIAWADRYQEYSEFLQIFDPVLKVIRKLPRPRKTG